MLSLQELEEHIGKSVLLRRMIEIFDSNSDGQISFEEFTSGLELFSSKRDPKDKLLFLFRIYDLDNDGYISNGELFMALKRMIGNNIQDEQLQQIVDKTIREADKDFDGKISFEEFENIIQSKNPGLVEKLTMKGI